MTKYTHLGASAGHRLYHAQTPDGHGYVLQLSPWESHEIELTLVGTHYCRIYPIAAGALTEGIVPTIGNLEGGYRTANLFLETWARSTEEQRSLLCEHETPIDYWRMDKKTHKPARNKTKVKLSSTPRVIPCRPSGDGWLRVRIADLRRALKGTTLAQTVRILGITVKRQFLLGTKANPGLLDTRSIFALDDVIELAHDPAQGPGGSLVIRTADKRARARVPHGATDKHGGRYGWDRRIVLQAAS